jgi:Aspartyl protease
MTIMDNHSRSSNRKQFFAFIHRGAFRPAIVLDVVVSCALTLFCSAAPHAHAASSQPNFAQNAEVMVFAAPDEFSLLVETIRDGESLSPMAEMTGPGGLKWFMVKTKNGNVGWIKAGESSAVRKIDAHFRSLPKDATPIGPASSEPESASKTPATGSITIPVRIDRNKVVVPVTFKSGTSSATGQLVVDTGAGQTMVSNQIARELRLFSIGSQRGIGIGGSVVAGLGIVEAVNVGQAEVRNMPISIHDSVRNIGYDGLLGFDFLGRFQMSVDSDKRVMVLTPRIK